MDDGPITRREFREVTEQLQSSINDARSDLGGRIDKVEARLDRVEVTIDKILDTLQRIEAMLKPLQDIPARVTRLEQKVFGR